jgi:putative endonuclease
MASHPSPESWRSATWYCHASSLHRQAKDVHRSSLIVHASEGGPPGRSQTRTPSGLCNRSFRSLAPITAQSRSPFDSTRQAACSIRDMRQRFVYVLRNADNPPPSYTGLTADVATRLTEHNAGSCIHTAKYRPWSIDVVIEFGEERRAVAFERYLKSGSGVAFAHRHLR